MLVEIAMKVEAKVLQEFVKEIFIKVNLPEDEAAFVANALVDSNLYGIDSHGVMRAPIYAKRCLNKAINTHPDFRFASTNKAVEILDGDNGHGIVVGRKAMTRAMELAKDFGIGLVGVKRSNHYGACSIYTRMAAEAGMVGISATNVKPLMIAGGAELPVVGNNPFSIAIPTFNDFPFVLDMALSVVARGKISYAAEKGVKIPLEWATDKGGRPTDDPKVALDGFIQAMGGYKGIAIAYAIDALCGVMTGAGYSYGVKSMYEEEEEPSQTGHMMIAVNFGIVSSPEVIREKMKAYHDGLLATPMWDKNQRVCFPGEIEQDVYKQRLAEGINIPESIFNELSVLGKTLGVKSELRFF